MRCTNRRSLLIKCQAPHVRHFPIQKEFTIKKTPFLAALAALSLSAFTVIADEPELAEVIAVGAVMTQDEAHKAADKAAF